MHIHKYGKWSELEIDARDNCYQIKERIKCRKIKLRWLTRSLTGRTGKGRLSL